MHTTSNMYTKILSRAITIVSLLLMLTGSFGQAFAQSPGTITITGVVTEVSGAPLPGVNVFVNELAIGTITDADGKYTLSVPDDATITF
ncbi:MAG TPA: carboxypeptidase-like regulatory domain-containing protein, partial [Saprospiraceae bacterium]|nr:carboxypeptidase-like regulatory domain-containing protein [Saprospiraceae bacterium]